jgi:hypothetical protein
MRIRSMFRVLSGSDAHFVSSLDGSSGCVPVMWHASTIEG